MVTSKVPDTVLIVDDEKDLADQIARHLKFLGFKADTANDAVEALEKMDKADYRVVITDIQMPGMQGDELLSEIKRRDGTVQVIVMSGHVPISRLIECLSLGACDCFSKPLDLEELAKGVTAAFARIQRWVTMMSEFRPTVPATTAAK